MEMKKVTHENRELWLEHGVRRVSYFYKRRARSAITNINYNKIQNEFTKRHGCKFMKTDTKMWPAQGFRVNDYPKSKTW